MKPLLSKKTLIVSLAAALLAVGGYAYLKITEEAKDPFTEVKSKTYATEGKIIEVSRNRVKFSAAVSSVKGGEYTITYQEKTAILSEKTVYSQMIYGKKFSADYSNLTPNSEITVETDVNPNPLSEINALEIVVVSNGL